MSIIPVEIKKRIIEIFEAEKELTFTEIGKRVKVPPNSVSRIIRNHKAGKSLERKSAVKGLPRCRVPIETKKKIIKEYRQAETTGKTKGIIFHLSKKYGVSYSVAQTAIRRYKAGLPLDMQGKRKRKIKVKLEKRSEKKTEENFNKLSAANRGAINFHQWLYGG